MPLTITLLIIIVTSAVSVLGFNRPRTIDSLIFAPPAISGRNQWYRFFSCGLIHADWGHLIFNMYSLYLFGMGPRQSGVELVFRDIFPGKGAELYLLMYVLALGICMIPSYIHHQQDYRYRSLGASGAVSAVIFSYILFYPTNRLGLIFVPIYIPGFLFGGIYLLLYYYWFAKRGGGRINHSAHVWGALFGILFTILVSYAFSDYPLLHKFVDQIRNFDWGHLVKFGNY